MMRLRFDFTGVRMPVIIRKAGEQTVRLPGIIIEQVWRTNSLSTRDRRTSRDDEEGQLNPSGKYICTLTFESVLMYLRTVHRRNEILEIGRRVNFPTVLPV